MKSTQVLRAHLRTVGAETAQDSENRWCPGRVRRPAKAAARERSLHGGGRREGPPRAVPRAATHGFHRMCPLGDCESLPGELTQGVLRRAASDRGAGSPNAEICACDSTNACLRPEVPDLHQAKPNRDHLPPAPCDCPPSPPEPRPHASELACLPPESRPSSVLHISARANFRRCKFSELGSVLTNLSWSA